jgi:hypothetical protein
MWALFYLCFLILSKLKFMDKTYQILPSFLNLTKEE